ncbi:MAG TPA: hypothetical protein VFC31_14870 [Candidatus Limnocylindria bacterium]|nr:hypothetical protein [Candidatus Limnocylindria bacterium]
MKALRVILASLAFSLLVLSSVALAGGGSMFVSPSSQTISVGGTAALKLDWSGYGLFNESFAMYYEGGGTIFDTYTCYSNCSTGTNWFYHLYNTSGTRYPKAADQYGGVSNSVTVIVN